MCEKGGKGGGVDQTWILEASLFFCPPPPSPTPWRKLTYAVELFRNQKKMRKYKNLNRKTQTKKMKVLVLNLLSYWNESLNLKNDLRKPEMTSSNWICRLRFFEWFFNTWVFSVFIPPFSCRSLMSRHFSDEERRGALSLWCLVRRWLSNFFILSKFSLKYWKTKSLRKLVSSRIWISFPIWTMHVHYKQQEKIRTSLYKSYQS